MEEKKPYLTTEDLTGYLTDDEIEKLRQNKKESNEYLQKIFPELLKKNSKD